MAVESATSSAMKITKRESGTIGMTPTKVGDAEIDVDALAGIPEQVAKARTDVIQDKIDLQTKKNEELESVRPDLETLSSVVNTMRGMSKPRAFKMFLINDLERLSVRRLVLSNLMWQ